MRPGAESIRSRRPRRLPSPLRSLVLLLIATFPGAACRTAAPVSLTPSDPAMEMLDHLRRRTFLWLWETTTPENGNPHVVRGLRRAGFSGGWLDHAP